MRVASSVKIGVALVVAGAAVYFGVGRWMRTRIVHPVDMPISLAKGHTRTGPFRLNLDATYVVYVQPNIDASWEQAHPDCNPYQHVQVRWVLYKGGKAVDRLDQPVTLPWLSGFDAGSGVYELDVEVLSDFHCVDSAGPRLEVYAYTDNYEAGAFLLKAIAVIGIGLGVYMLTFLPMVRFAGSRGQISHVTDEATAAENVQWAQKLPLRKPTRGLPGFGLYAGTFAALMALTMMALLGAFRYQPKGLWVHLLKPGAVPLKSDQWTEPLIVRVQDAGAGQEPELFVDAKQVAWDDLGPALREELVLRREWVVYVEGDDCVAWANVASVIDIARSDGAKVVLLTEKYEKECKAGSPAMTGVGELHRSFGANGAPQDDKQREPPVASGPRYDLGFGFF